MIRFYNDILSYQEVYLLKNDEFDILKCLQESMIWKKCIYAKKRCAVFTSDGPKRNETSLLCSRSIAEYIFYCKI